MVRTRIYLTARQKQCLERMAVATGRRQSDLICAALDEYLAQKEPKDWFDALEPMFGMWSDRSEMDEHVSRVREEADERLAHRWSRKRS
jgi:hypothetical protein